MKDKKTTRTQSKDTPLVDNGARLNSLLSQWYADSITNRNALGIDNEILAGVAADRMEASPDEAAMFARLGVTKETYDPLTHTRCSAARSLLLDVLGGTITRPFGLEPTPDPEMPVDAESAIVAGQFAEFFEMVKAGAIKFSPETATAFLESRFDDIVEQKTAWAKKRTGRMEALVNDVLTEGGFDDALETAIDDACVRGTAIVGWTKMTVPSIKNTTGRWVHGTKNATIYRRVDPLNVYPMPGVVDFSGNVFVRVSWPIHGFEKMGDESGTGWRSGGVKAVMARVTSRGLTVANDQGAQTEEAAKRAEKTDAFSNVRRNISGVEFWGEVPENVIVDTESTRSVRIHVAFSDNDIVKFRRLQDWETTPYAKAHFYHTAASFFGVGIPRVLRSPQAGLNVVAAMFKKNVQLASSASLVYNNYRSLIGNETPGAAALDAWKIFAFEKETSGAVTGKPLEVLQIDSRIGDLEKAYALYQQIADEVSGVPRYVYGQSSSATGAGRTLGGLKMLRDAALRGITAGLANLDTGIVKRVVIDLVAELNTSDDVSDQVKCDCTVVSAGVLGMVQRSVETQERLQMLGSFANSPVLTQVVGLKVLQGMARRVLMDQNIEDIETDMPSHAVLETRELLSMLQQAGGDKQGQSQQDPQATDGQGSGSIPSQPNDVGQTQQTQQTQPQAGSVAERRGVA